MQLIEQGPTVFQDIPQAINERVIKASSLLYFKIGKIFYDPNLMF